MKRSWWKVTAYCTAASLASFYLYVYVLGRFALVTTPDGAVTADSTRVIIVCGILFAAIVAFGGLVFFRRMTRRETALSAAVYAGLGAVIWLIASTAGISGQAAVLCAQLMDWHSFAALLLTELSVPAGRTEKSADTPVSALLLSALFTRPRRLRAGFSLPERGQRAVCPWPGR